MTSIYADNHKFEKLKKIILITLMFALSINTVFFLLSALKVFCVEYLLFFATTELIFGVLILTVLLLLRDDIFE